MHHGFGRQKRIRAGLRYSKGGKAKYWIPLPGDEARNRGETGPISALKRRVDQRLAGREGYAPLLPKQAAKVVHDDPAGLEGSNPVEWTGIFDESDSEESDAPSLDFESVHEDEDNMYERARRVGYAGFPNVDVSQEEKKRRVWEEEEGILAGKWSRGGRRENGAAKHGKEGRRSKSSGNKKGKAKAEAKGRMGVYGACVSKLLIAASN